MFIPWKKAVVADPDMVHRGNLFYKRTFDFSVLGYNVRLFWKPENFLLFGWAEIFFPPLIAFIIFYVYKQNVLIVNMVLKVVNGYYTKSYNQFKFEILKI